MSRIFSIILTIIVLSSCNKDNFTIDGQITNSPSSMIYLEQLNVTGSIPFDSSKVDSKGNFSLSGRVSYPTFFLLKLNNQKFITLLVDSAEKISFSADFLNYSKDYMVEGSLGSQKVKQLNDKLAQTNNRIDSLQSLISLFVNSPDYPAKRAKWVKDLEETYSSQQEYSKKFIEENPFSMASVLAIYQQFNDGNYVMQDIQTLKMAASALHSMYPQSTHAQTLYKDTEKLIKDIKARKVRAFIEQHGMNSPEVVLPDSKGKEIALSLFRGKTVLVHFWSANDRASRLMNDVLVENYKVFKSKGFEIYQISIDTDRDAWIQAINEDRLSWTNVGDMQGSIAAVNSFNISKVPGNYLLGKDGSIIAKDLKGPALYATLSKVLN